MTLFPTAIILLLAIIFTKIPGGLSFTGNQTINVPGCIVRFLAGPSLDEASLNLMTGKDG
jgi:hypothetical protein